MDLHQSVLMLEERAIELMDENRDLDRVYAILQILATNRLVEEIQGLREDLGRPFGSRIPPKEIIT